MSIAIIVQKVGNDLVKTNIGTTDCATVVIH